MFSQKKLRFGIENGLPSHHTTRQDNEYGFYASEQKRTSFTEEDWTCGNESYRFPIETSPKDPWERCFEVVDKADEELYKELKDEISDLLIIASLLLGIVTAFSTMSFGWLRVDDRKVSTALLGDIVRLLNDTDARGTVHPRDPTTLDFNPRHSEVVVNQMWFLSMTLSLSAVMVGTLCLQWLSTFRRKELKQRTYDDALALRQLRFEGITGWGVRHVPEILLLTVQSAVVLFSTGLMYLLWSVNKQVAIPVLVFGGFVALLLIITTAMPLLQSVIGWLFPSTLIIPQCPYKSPVSWLLHRGCVLLSIIVTLPFCWLDKVPAWREEQKRLLTDYTWHIFDVRWRDQREKWGPQQTRSKHSHYLVNGLVSAMEKLVFKPDAIHIIDTCLQDFHGAPAEEETLEYPFGEDAPAVRQALSEYNAIVEPTDIEKSNKCLIPSHKENLRRDFLNAYILQRFVAHKTNLHRPLLSHRVELYIRIKRSSQHFPAIDEGGPGSASGKNRFIGTSIVCPIRNAQDAEALSSELRHQYLKFADWFLDTERCSDSDIRSLEYFMQAKNVRTAPDTDIEQSQYRLKSVPKTSGEQVLERSCRSRRLSNATRDFVFVVDRGSEQDAQLDHGQADQGNRSSGGLEDSGDEKEVTPTSFTPAAWTDLYQSVQGKLETRSHMRKHQKGARARRGRFDYPIDHSILPR